MHAFVRRVLVGTLAAGAVAVGGIGVGTASAATVDEQAAPVAQVTAYHWDRCDDFNRRWDRDCVRHDRWYWDRGHHRWNHWRWEDRDRRWENRGWR